MNEARGRFDVDMISAEDRGDGIGRFAVAKTFHGDLQGAATGDMLAVRMQRRPVRRATCSSSA